MSDPGSLLVVSVAESIDSAEWEDAEEVRDECEEHDIAESALEVAGGVTATRAAVAWSTVAKKELKWHEEAGKSSFRKAA